jgi:DNA-binding CsgD family transcriptional regulator
MSESAPGEEELLEREHEVAAVADALGDACAGVGSLVVIDGPAGIGKSRLLSGALAEGEARGMDVLSARAIELERQLPFGAATELFGSRLAGAPRERDALLAGQAGLAASLVDPTVAAPADAHALVRGLYWLTVNLTSVGAAPRPLLLAVDDVQWADPPSLRFLAYLAARVRELPLALVVTVRSGEQASAPELVDWLREQPDHRVLRPRPLTERAVGRMVAAELPDPEPAFVHACADVSGGNPFLARELVRSLHADGVAPTADAAPGVERLLPTTVLQSVLIRLARLGDDCQRLARALAVLGDRATLRHAAALAELDPQAAEEAADALARAHVLDPGEPLRFTHALIATAVDADLPAFARARAHRRAAELLAVDGAPVDAVATHLLMSRPEGEPQTVETLRRSAERAVTRGDDAAAARLLERALAEPPPAAARADVLLELATAKMRIGAGGAGAHIDAALELLDGSEARVRALAARARLLLQMGEYATSARAVEEALDELDGEDPRSQELIADELNAIFLQLPLRDRAGERLAPLAAAARDGRQPGHPGLAAHLALHEAFDGAAPERVRVLAEAATSADPLAGSPIHGLTMGIAVQALMCVDELDAAERIADAAVAATRERGAVAAYASASFHRALPRYERGALDDALADLEQALAPRSEGWTAAVAWIGALQAHVELARGDLAGAHAGIALAGDVPPESIDHAVVGFARARLALAERDPAAALLHAETTGRLLVDGFGIDHPGWLPWRCTAAIAAHALGDHERAGVLARTALERAQACGAARPLGHALRCSAHVGDGDRRLGLLHAAVDVLERSPSLLERVHALVELGAALRRSGQRAAAQPPLREALQLADRMDAVPLVTNALEELRATGARPRRSAYSGADALTPTERRVARLAVEGLTNPQIAQALFVTPKTIQTHLAHTYRKLGIGSRRELAGALGERPER